MSVYFIHQILSCVLQVDCFKSLPKLKLLANTSLWKLNTYLASQIWLTGWWSWTWLRCFHWSLKVIQKEHSGERSLQKPKKGKEWNISNIKRGLPRGRTQEKGKGIPDFFTVLNKKLIVTPNWKIFLSYCLFSLLITIPVQ